MDAGENRNPGARTFGVLHLRTSFTAGATFNYDVYMGAVGGRAFEFKGPAPRIPRCTPYFPDKLAQELAHPSPAFCRTKVHHNVTPPCTTTTARTGSRRSPPGRSA